MFSLESPHRGDCNEYTQYTILNTKKERNNLIILNLQLWDFSRGLKNEFETAVVNETSMFEPLKVYCILPAVYTIHISARVTQNSSCNDYWNEFPFWGFYWCVNAGKSVTN